MFSAMKKRISSLYSAAARRPLVSLVVLVAVVFGTWFFIFRDGDTTQETLVVEAKEFVQEVSVSGKVVAAQNVDLTFSETGRVASIGVIVGDTVVVGEAIASLALDTLSSDLRAAEVDLAEARKEQERLLQVRTGTFFRRVWSRYQLHQCMQ